MISKNKLCAVLLLASMLVSSLCSCGMFSELTKDKQSVKDPLGGLQIDELDLVSTKTAPAPVIPEYSGKNTLTAAIQGNIGGSASPFFYNTEAGALAADLTHIRLLTLNREGDPVLNGNVGQTFSYLGEDHTYSSIADVEVIKNSDGTADYVFSLREDVFFSDGTNLTADDAIFCMYVLLDPSYSGSSTLPLLPIVGLDAYREDMLCLGDIIYDATLGKTAPEGISDNDVQRFNDRLGTAEQIYISQLLKGMSDRFEESVIQQNAGKWTDRTKEEKYLASIAMVMYGYAVWEKSVSGDYTGTLITAEGKKYDCTSSFPSYSEMFLCIASENDSLLEIDQKHPEASFESALREAFGSSYEHFFEVKKECGRSAASVSGITKNGMYSFTVRLGRYDVSDIYGFDLHIAPLHAYGSRDEYKYTENRFGFVKGDLRRIKNKSTNVCSGPYTYLGENGGAYRFERNKLYYLGCPNITYVELVSVLPHEDVAAGVAEGKYDMASSALTAELLESLDKANKQKNTVSVSKYSNGDYLYIGLNCDSLRIGEDASSSRSMSLRRAFGALFSYFAQTSYHGSVGDITFKVSGPARIPDASLDGADGIYAKDLFGEDICTSEMTEREKLDSLRTAVLGYFASAGYILDKSEAKIESAPSGGVTEFTFWMASDSMYSGYIEDIVKNSGSLLSDIGITLKVGYSENEQALLSRIGAENVRMWACVRRLSADTSPMSCYYSKNSPKHRDGTGENLSRIADAELDELIGGLAVADDKAARAGIFRKAYEKVCENGAEIPLCIGYDVLVFSPLRIEGSSELSSATGYYTWTDIIHKIKLY